MPITLEWSWKGLFSRNTLALAAAVALVDCVVGFVLRRRFQSRRYLNEIMFFTDKGAGCQEHNTSKERCNTPGCAYSNIRRIVEYIESTQKTLDVCIYLITCQDLANAILRVHYRGKHVRVIADSDMAEGSGSQIAMFRRFEGEQMILAGLAEKPLEFCQTGICVKMKKSPYLMHHKFFIVDHRIILTGSFNWTMQAITGNWDNVIVTTQPDIVSKFDQQFSKLWNEFIGSEEDLEVEEEEAPKQVEELGEEAEDLGEEEAKMPMVIVEEEEEVFCSAVHK